MYEFALFGSPVQHSLSAVLHSHAADMAGICVNYTLQEVDPSQLSEAIEVARNTHLRGLNFTAPHKTQAVAFMDVTDDLTQQINAVNTVVFDDQGRAHGHNTDVWGFQWALGNHRPRHIGVLGAGGAARAVVCGLRAFDLAPVIFHRSIKGISAMTSLGLSAESFQPVAMLNSALKNLDLLVICAPPNVYQRLLKLDWCTAKPGTRIMTLGYGRPSRVFCQTLTHFGVRAEDGLSMLAAQGQMGFELWTGKKLPIEPLFENLKRVAARRWDD